ncbi:FAD/NAD(P)-binding protein [Saccharopolyspora soli]|uniref:FAD/NAD(P)-binding protein n=1 Tax=Saccharopolyspora soli TaxID=2926618 RepID=UPI002412EF77|nr:FAD/NAD(P)-binding domain-containing protein [Saccharopolyspora soli]
MDPRVSARPTTRVVVAGAGPRGLSVVERLVARAADRRLDIVLTDPYLNSGGRVWRADQSSDFLMNTMISDNTVFPDSSVTLDAPVGTGPTFADWIATTGRTGEPALDEFLATATDRDYAPRSLYGRYLQAARQRVLGGAPENVRIECRETEVVGIAELRDGFAVTFADRSCRIASDVVLATGHLDAPPRPGRRHIGAGHPADYPLDEIDAGAELLLRGAGLNAFDVIARLTSGRGGVFDGSGRYRPSGREPHIWITSRRGLPFHARVDTPDFHPPVAFLTPERVAELCAAPRLDFARDVLPLLIADLELAWYSRILPQHEVLGPRRLAVPAALRLDLDALLDPLGGRSFADLAELRAWWADYLDRDHREATAPQPSPQAALIAAIRHARPALRKIITAGNLTGDSYRRDVLGMLNRWANFLSGGPPALRIKQLRGLLAAGVVDLLGPLKDVQRFESALVPGLHVSPDHVVDAWIPPIDVTTPGPGLLRTLLADGLARPHRLVAERPGHPPIPTGALDVRPSDGRVRRPDGRVHRGLFAAGIPLEGVRWTTAIGARPGTDADFFHETDAIAAAILNTALDAFTTREAV